MRTANLNEDPRRDTIFSARTHSEKDVVKA